MRSLTNLLWAAAFALIVAPAAAQNRTPTNPLDVPPPSPDAPTPLPPTETPIAPLPPPSVTDPVIPRAAGTPPPPLEDLLPESTRQPGGMTEAKVVARARRAAVGVDIAEAQRRSAEAGVTAAQLSFIPNVTLSARYTRLSEITPGTIGFFNTPACLQDIATCQADPGAFQQQVVLQEPILNQYSFVASARWNLTDLVGARRFELEAAEAEAEAAAASAEAATRDVAFDAVVAYWDVVRARAQHELARDSLEAAEKAVRDAEMRRSQGVATDLEVLQATGNARGYQRLVKVTESRVEMAETALRHLLGLEDDAPIALDARLDDLPEEPKTSLAAMKRRALESSAEVAAARARADAAGARASSREARMYPSLTTSFNLNYDNPNQRIFPQEEKFTATWDASVQLSWSLDGTIVGIAQVEQLREAETAQRRAIVQAEQAIEQRVIAARGNLEAALMGVEAAHYAAGSAAESARQTRGRRAAGMATITEELNAEAASLSAKLDLVDALVDARVAQADLERVVGNGRTQ